MNAVSLTCYEAWYRDGGLDTYAEVFSHYDEKAIEVELVVSRIKERLSWRSGSPAAVLDIGCGTGRFTVMLLDSLCANHSGACEFEADLVDINPDAFVRFRNVAAEARHARIAVRKTVTAPWRLVDENHLLPPYNLIIADHVFYGEPMTAELINGRCELLAPAGVAIVSLQTTDADVYRMREQAGITTNAAEDFAALLQRCATPAEMLAYESRLYFDIEHTTFRDWFFATSTLDQTAQERLLDTFSHRDGQGRTYLTNRANMFLIWGGKRSGKEC